jgi:hypothetical protein
MTGFYKSMFVGMAAIGWAGCMLAPTDDGRVATSGETLPFQGYVTEPSVPVQVRAWDYAANAMASVGAPVMSGTAPTALDDGELYFWSAPRVLPARFWRSGPGGGQCAAVGAQTTIAGSTYNVITVESSWGSCFNDHQTIGGFFANCQSNDSPVALIYTNNWGSVTVNQSALNLAGLVASSQISLTLDNFTPMQGQFCNTGNLAGCPPTLGADPPMTYQFYQPAASSLTQTGQPPLTFSISPSRDHMMTVYVDDLTSQSIDFSTSGSQFVLGIDFESAGPEIRLNCIDNPLCIFLGDPVIELATPRAEIRFALAMQGGHVTYTSAAAVFTTSSTDSRALQAAAAIGAAMAEKLNSDPGIKGAVATAIDSVIRQTAGLGAMPIDGVTVGGGTVQVRPGCPMD